MKRNDLVKTLIIMLSTVIATVGLALLLNLVTGQKIAQDAAKREELAAQQAAGELLAVFPGATGFEEITANLTISSESGVTSVYKEKSDKGYVVIAQKRKGQMKDVVIVTFGVADGKITGLVYKLANEKDFSVSDATINSIIGNDSTLNGVVNTTGASNTTDSIKAAVNAGFLVLAENDLMKAKAKETEQVFEELLPTVLPGFIQGDAVEGSTANIYKAYKSKNNACLIAYVNTDGGKLLTVTSMDKDVTVYKANLLDEKTQTYELEDVTSANEAVVTEVKEFANANLKTSLTALNRKIKTLFNLTDDEVKALIKEELAISEVGHITAAVRYEIGTEEYYAYNIKMINTYDNSSMNTYIVLDSEGNIYHYTTGTYFADADHFHIDDDFLPTKGQYEAKFEGVNSGTFNEEDVVIAGATLTTNALKEAFKIVFAEFNALGGNN